MAEDKAYKGESTETPQPPAPGVPDENTWLAAARKLNPNVSDDKLRTYYRNNYGAKYALRDLTSLRSNVFGPQPKTPAQPAPQIAQQELVGRIERGQRAEQAIPKLGEMESQATEEKIRAQQAVRKGVAAEQLKQEQAFGGREETALETKQAGVMAEPEFKPDKMELDDYRNLAGMLIGIGTLVGGKGKMGAMYSLQALNGMMKGYAEGRKDLFKTQQVEFEKALKSVDAHNKRIDREFNDAMSLINTDRRTALAKLKQLEAELGDGVMAADLRLNDLGKLRKDIDSAVKSGSDALKMVETSAQRQADREFKEQLARDRMQQQRELAEFRASTQKEIAELKKGEGKPLPPAEIRKLEGLESISKGLDELKRDFKPEYAQLGVLGFGAEFSLEAKRRLAETLGDKEAQRAVAWWGKYQRLQAPNRHALFGATLTGNELKNYLSFTAKPSDSASTIINSLDDQKNYSTDLARSQRFSFESVGYKVPPTSPSNYIESFGGQRSEPTRTLGQQEPAASQPASQPSAKPAAKRMPEPETLQAYADQKFNGNVEKARQFLKSQGYQ